MLAEWRIRNFKSFGDTASVFGFSKLNMVCGANSSGKSSLIQSILLAAQTLDSDDEKTSLLLNGKYVRLGFPSDVVHGRRNGAQVEIGFEVFVQNDDNSSIGGDHLDESLHCIASFRLPEDIRSADYGFRLASVSLRSGQFGVSVRPDRSSGRLSVAVPADGQYLMSDELRRKSETGVFDFAIDDTTSLSNALRLASSEFPSHAQVRNFLPIKLMREVEIDTRQLIEKLKRIPSIINLTEVIGVLGIAQHVRLNIEPGKTIAAEIVHVIDENKTLPENPERVQLLRDVLIHENSSLGKWMEGVLRSDAGVRKFMRDALTKSLPALERELKRKPQNIRGSTMQVPYPQIDYGVQQCRTFFSEQIRYLGPLRDDPRMIYALPDALGSMDVGKKGEFTAYVIDKFGDYIVECPSSFEQSVQSASVPMSLKSALTIWLERMGLTFGIQTKDRGKIGTELSISARGLSDGVDLTNVGVGVSQVLPMLTMCLLAPKGALILLEQPELHLHPRVQSVLTDFLLGIARSGRQCIVETHSERMVNRTRLRIAESSDRSIMDAVRIFFVEKPDEETVVRPVEPNEYGAIPDWPAGFFDEGPDEAERIIRAAMMKRRSGSKTVKS
jgi:predicted ATPase